MGGGAGASFLVLNRLLMAYNMRRHFIRGSPFFEVSFVSEF